MRRRLWLFITATLLTGAAMIATLISWTPQQASAHQTKEVGGGRYRVIVGMVREPSFTNERNGLDLIVRTADNQPGEGLERS
ncbi:MAG: hypothetical protein QN135_10740, partial [Armatimonadota bacterium]|nr:hypothetical protein [Armatimonadota bacterium]